MRLAYLDCASGISGDMTAAALIDAGVDPEAIRRGIRSLGLAGVELSVQTVLRCGFRATYISVAHPEQHAHRGLNDIRRIIDQAGDVTPPQKALAGRIFTALAEAEAKVHGTSPEAVHFHEVGAIDSIVDVVAAAIGFDLLGVDEIVASPVPTGRGQVRIAHGVCRVPTPGTAELLKGIPLVDVPVDSELTTPTGAAILKSVAGRFGHLPAMTIERIGYGAGTRDFPDRANVLRILVGTAEAAEEEFDTVSVLETNLDDVSGEVIGYTKRKLLSAGALDVYTTAIAMKKDRPGVLLTVLCRPADRAAMERIVLSETGTFGIRHYPADRTKRRRAAHTVSTPWGPVQGKLGAAGGRTIFSPEYESCAAIAAQFNVPLRDVSRAAEAAYATAPVEISAGAQPSAERHDHSHDHSHDHTHDHSHDHHH